MELLLERIDARLNALSLSDNDASAQTGKDRSLIRDLRRRAAENKPLRVRMDTLERLSDTLQTSVDYLVGKVDDPSFDRRRIRKVPVLSAHTLRAKPHEMPQLYGIFPTVPVGPDAFAFIIVDRDMIDEPNPETRRSLFQGDMVIIDPDLKAEPGDIVLAVVDGRVVVRRYQESRVVAGLTFVRLAPLNPNYPTFEFDESDYHATRPGVLVEHRRSLTRRARIFAP